MERMLCSDLSYEELVRFLSPAERRSYWFGRQIGYFRRRKLGYKSVYSVWVSSKRWKTPDPGQGALK